LSALENLKIQNSVTQRGAIAADQPQDIARTNNNTEHHPHNNESETNHHTCDDITPTVYNDVSRECSVDSEQQPRSQSSEDAGHRRRQNVRQ
jgi:hypothetical protein